MNKAISLGLVVVGIILIGFGTSASNSASSSLSRLYTGSPSDKTLWFFIGGGLAAAIGAAGLIRREKSR